MKLVIINSEFPPIGGGAGNASSNIARQMVLQGHEVIHFSTQHRDFPNEELWQGVKIVRVPAIRRHLDRSNPIEQLSFALMGSVSIIQAVKKISPDLILAFFGIPCGLTAYSLKQILGIPYIVSLRGGDVPGFRPYDFKVFHRLVSPILRVIWRSASSLVANSAGMRDLALRFQPNAQIELIPNGVDVNFFIPAYRDWRVPHLLSVGRVVYQKGLDLALSVLTSLKEYDWEWTIAGDGVARQELELLAKQLKIDDRIHFVGWQSKEQLTTLYHTANIFLFPSRHEGMPNAVLEAMASGLPVVASEIAGNEELVLPNQTGILFTSEDQNGLRQGLERLLSNAELRQQMGAAGRRRVESEYTWDKVAREYTSLISKITGSK